MDGFKCSLAKVVMLSLGFLFSVETYATLVYGRYSEINEEATFGNEYAKEIIKTSFEGLSEGIMAATAGILVVNGDRIVRYFCMSDDEYLSHSDLKIIVDGYISRHKREMTYNSKMASISIKALREKYPCQ